MRSVSAHHLQTVLEGLDGKLQASGRPEIA